MITARTREIGLRIALGASSPEIIRMVFAGASKMLAGGILLGLALTLATERILKTVLFGVSPLDAPALACAVAVLCAVSSLAVFLPARRAAAIDPLDAMRAE